MMNIPLQAVLLLAVLLFLIGLIGLLSRRNILFMLLSLEIMLNASGLAFIASGARWSKVDGQVMFIFILAVAAAEVAVGLALVLLMFRKYRTLDINILKRMRG